MNRLKAALLVIATTAALGFTLAAAINLDPDIDTDTLRDAQESASAQARLDHARATLCGHPNAWVELEDGSTRCVKHSRQPTERVAQVQP